MSMPVYVQVLVYEPQLTVAENGVIAKFYWASLELKLNVDIV